MLSNLVKIGGETELKLSGSINRGYQPTKGIQ